jgi:hypothetical protein
MARPGRPGRQSEQAGVKCRVLPGLVVRTVRRPPDFTLVCRVPMTAANVVRSTRESGDKLTSADNRGSTIFAMVHLDIPLSRVGVTLSERVKADGIIAWSTHCFGLQIFGSIVNPGAAPYRQAIPFLSRLVNVSDQSPLPLHCG